MGTMVRAVVHGSVFATRIVLAATSSELDQMRCARHEHCDPPVYADSSHRSRSKPEKEALKLLSGVPVTTAACTFMAWLGPHPFARARTSRLDLCGRRLGRFAVLLYRAYNSSIVEWKLHSCCRQVCGLTH